MKNKLAQKSSGTQSEETVLMKSFKYFDLNNNGTVEPEEFAKAIEKIGIMIPTKQVSIAHAFRTLRPNLAAAKVRRLADMAKILIKIFIYRIWTLSSTYMMLTRVEPSTTRSSPPESLEALPRAAPPRRAVAATPKSWLAN